LSEGLGPAGSQSKRNTERQWGGRVPILATYSFRQEGVADMTHQHLSRDERYSISGMRARGHSQREIALCIGRSPSTISREIRRNSFGETGKYWADRADASAMARRWRSRKKSQFSQQDWAEVEELLQQEWSPKQIVGIRYVQCQRMMSYETIYRRVRSDRRRGGRLWTHMRHMSKPWRKRKGSPATRGRLLGKRHISERPAEVETRQEVGHTEGDTVMGADLRHCVLTLVERMTGYLVIKKLQARTKEQAANALARALIKLRGVVKSVTLDNGTEFHDYKLVEEQFGVPFYFATPYHSWERGTNENTNGLIRQYLPKGICLKNLTQAQCDQIAAKLNTRPRERLGFRTPAQALTALTGVAFQC
jgi:transposase, IS30 family